MGDKNKTLLLFTGEFPFGKKGEPFLEDEIFYLAEYFNKIYIFPRRKSSFLRKLPEKAEVIDSLTFSSFKISNQPISLLLKGVFAVIYEAIRTKQGYKYFKHPKHFVYIWLEAKKIADLISEWLMKEQIKNYLCYTYWSDSSLLACSILKEKGKLDKIITRTHGFDLYNERNIGGIVSYRNTKYKQANKIFCVSQHGKSYLEQNIPSFFHKNIHLSYLGVNPTKYIEEQTIPDIPIVVTCARMEVFKRISMIPDVLSKIDFPVHWVHFGDGPEFEQVQEKINTLPNHIKATLMGQRKNQEILDFYCQNHVSLLLSLSTSEGLPVSMMEAISFGIPVLATSINGVPEIVTNETGILLSIDENFESIAKKIDCILQNKPFDTDKIKTFYFEHFNAETNYSNFAKEIAACIS